MGQSSTSIQQVENYPPTQLLFSATKPINRFHFIFNERIWQRKCNNSAVIWISSYINQPTSKYFIKSQNKMVLENNRLTAYAFKELEVLKNRIPGTLEMMFAFQDACNLYLCTKYIDGYALQDIMKGHIFTQSETKFVICSLIKIIENLHSLGYACVSLDPQTIIFDMKQQSIKLLDLPDLNKLGQTVNTRSVGKSYLYSAPQTIEGLPSQMESDYYSLGLVMYEMMTRKRPFQFDKNSKQKQDLLGCKIEITKSQIPEGWTPSAIQFLIKLLIKNPQYRLGKYGPTEVREDQWIQGYDWSSLNDKSKSKIPFEHDRLEEQKYKPVVHDESLPCYKCPIFQSIFKTYTYEM